MFAYIDESGHTGKNISNGEQPTFFYLGLVTKSNLDILLKKEIDLLKKDYNIEEIHGAELGNKIEDISMVLINILKRVSPNFFLSIVEKKYLAYAKLFDTLFDNIENPGARYHTYQFRPFRLLLMNNFCFITPPDVAYKFYEECLLGKNEEESLMVFVETCDVILSKIDLLQDNRSQEIISDALEWAKNNPQEITSYNTRKIDRWRHLPNVATFLPVMDMISRCSKKYKSPIKKIVHDEQQQIKKNYYGNS